METPQQKLDEETRLANTDPGNRITMRAEDYNALQKKLDHAMAEVYADRLGEIPETEPGKSYSNAIVAARIGGKSMFSFGQANLPYLIVRDKFAISGYGSDHSVNVATAFASVTADSRRFKESCWETNRAFGDDGRHKILFGELTLEAARKVANGLVDFVRDHVVVQTHLASLPYLGKVQPFMTAVAGHVLIHDGHTGKTYAEDWTGICVDSQCTKKFWYIGHSEGDRSFSALAAKDMRSAILESQPIMAFEKEFYALPA